MTTATTGLDVDRVRGCFDAIGAGRIVTNNAASTQPPRELVDLYSSLVPSYENVHRGQSAASRRTTELFEEAYDTIAGWLNAPGRRSISTYRNTTEAHNAVMYSLLTEFRDGDNVVTTHLEHNSNFVPWFGLCRDIMPAVGRQVDCRLARFDPATGSLDLDHLASLVDNRTKLVCCTGASNFIGTKPPLERVSDIAHGSGYRRPNGGRGSLLLVDGAQLVPTAPIDVSALDVDYLSFSFHKFLAPFGVGALYAKEELLRESRPFLYGGDMIAAGGVYPDRVEYNELPWKYSAGTPNILGVIASAQALRWVADMAAPDTDDACFGTVTPVPRQRTTAAMRAIGEHTAALTTRAHDLLARIPGLTVHGPDNGIPRSPLLAFSVRGWSPFTLAEALDARGVEARAGCHCATLAHRFLRLDPPASCRLSFAVYNSTDDVDHAAGALRDVVTGRTPPARAPAERTGLPGRHRRG
jgi:cysteine desulfurase/selenocysteine lyase